MKKSLVEFDLAMTLIREVTKAPVDILAVSISKRMISVFFRKEFPPIQFRLKDEKWVWFWHTGNGDLGSQSLEVIEALLKGAYE